MLVASVHPRKNRDGEITSWQVRWRERVDGRVEVQTERFGDEESARVFKQAVDVAGQHWPPGWVRGEGFVAPGGAADDERYRFRNFAFRSIENRTGVEERYRADCQRELRQYVFPTFGECDVRSTEHFSSETVRAWVRQLEQTKVWRGSQHKPMSPKTIKNLHGLLSSILNEAVRSEPPLRARNPCELTRLPRLDDDGVDDDGEDVCFLTPQEVAGIASYMRPRRDQLVVRIAYGTGFRWGELSALKPDRVLDPRSARPRLRVTRAWKRRPGGAYYLGKPKTKRSRRTIRAARMVIADLAELGLFELGPEDLIIHNGAGERLPYSTFYDHWVEGVALAHERGLLPTHKNPTPHDLRHSCAAGLISDGHSLTYVQRYLGHESITTTSDLYGHLLPEADDGAMATLDRLLTTAPVPPEEESFLAGAAVLAPVEEAERILEGAGDSGLEQTQVEPDQRR